MKHGDLLVDRERFFTEQYLSTTRGSTSDAPAYPPIDHATAANEYL